MADFEEYKIEDLQQFAMEIIRKTGDVALRYYGKGDPRLKFDEALVTEAELNLADVFRTGLAAKFPGHRVFGDASMDRDYDLDKGGCLWIFDAPSGVANFQAGIPLWGISVALVENLWPVFGAFYMPVSGDLFYSIAGRKAYWGNEPIQQLNPDEISNESLLLTYSRFQGRYRTTFPGKIRNMGCNAAHICYVARGRAEAALLANVSYADIAAAYIILQAAGGEIRTLEGKTLQLNEYLGGQKIEEHHLAAPKGTHKAIGAYIKEIL
jgi:myo-inositol-1(or 4)-monophosphatase